MKFLLLILLCAEFGMASTYSLKRVLHSANEHSAMKKALKQEALSRASQNLAQTASDPLEFSGMAIKAYPQGGGSGNEYAVGFSKKIMLGNIQDEQRQINALNDQAYLLDAQRNILNYKNSLKNLYHQHCIDYENYKSFQKSYRDFATLYRKKRKAYEYQEISKTELMQLELEKNRLSAKAQELKMTQEISKQGVFRLSSLPYTGQSSLSCRDLYPIRTAVSLGERLRLSKQAYEKRIERTHAKLTRYSHALESVDVAMQYNQEIDIDRYGIGVSIPLNFTSKKSEHARAAAMYENSAVHFQYEQKMLEKRNAISQLQARLRGQAEMLHTYEKNYRDYMKKLLPLSKKSYDLGETSAIEYLLTQQKSYQVREEMYAMKKAYYRTLFQLYSVSEKKDNK